MFNNTFFKLTRKKNQRATSNTVFHITNENRKNPIFINKALTYTHPTQTAEKGKTRADISRKLSSAKTRLKNHEANLKSMLKSNKHGEKVERKKQSIENTKRKIVELEMQKLLTKDRRKEQLHYSHVEIIFSITNTKDLNNKGYLKDLNEAGLEFLRDRFRRADIKVSVGHQDQNQPHIHAVLEYGNGTNLTQDLNRAYGKKPMQYSDLQIDFNRFMQVHSIGAKYDFYFDEIVRGGRKEYKSLPEFKKLTKKVKEAANNEVRKVFEGLDYFNFGFFKVPTFSSISKLKKVLHNNIANKLINAQFPALVSRLLKRTKELENREELYENKIKSIEEKLSKAQDDFKNQTSQISILLKSETKNLEQITLKTSQVESLNKELSLLQEELVKVKDKDVGE